MKISLRKIILFEITYKFNSFVLLKLFKKIEIKKYRYEKYFYANVHLLFHERWIKLRTEIFIYLTRARLLLLPFITFS